MSIKFSEHLKALVREGKLDFGIYSSTIKVPLYSSDSGKAAIPTYVTSTVQPADTWVADSYVSVSLPDQEARNKALRAVMEQMQKQMNATSGGPTGWINAPSGFKPYSSDPIPAPPPAPEPVKAADKRIDEMTHLDYQKCCANFFKKQSVWT